MRGWRFFCVVGAVWFCQVVGCEGARISEVGGGAGWWERAGVFVSGEDGVVRYAVWGAVLSGLCCGLMGPFLVVRRLSLLGDALAHAVLPGVVVGFLWNMERDAVAIFVGACVAGALGVGVLHVLRRTTRLREDALLGFVLASFFGVGVCLLSMVQNLPGVNKGGLEGYLFGQAVGMGREDVVLLGVVVCVVGGVLWGFWGRWKWVSFDELHARSVGVRVGWWQGVLMVLLAMAIVVSLKALGVVLVTALLVLPSCAAFLLCRGLGGALVVSAVLGGLSGLGGAFFSYTGRGLPTGPAVVLMAAAFFVVVLLFAPGRGVVAVLVRRFVERRRMRREHALGSFYRYREQCGGGVVSLEDWADFRGEGEAATGAVWRRLVQSRDAVGGGGVGGLRLSRRGEATARRVVRNHRLWELYLTRRAELAPDHVHDNADRAEHVLDEETVRRLREELGDAQRDPHGSVIPDGGEGGAR